MKSILTIILVAPFMLIACNSNKKQVTNINNDSSDIASTTEEIKMPSKSNAVAYFASGCFWCVEAIFESVEGVEEVVSGYAGGTASDANYSDVSNGTTKHAESVKVFYDSTKVSYMTLLKVFFGSHDPTTLNRQGPDAGTQYRSAIFYKSDQELSQIKLYIEDLYKTGVFAKGSLTTEITPLKAFYDAEGYHQDYEKNNPNQPYVKGVSVPRLNKFKSKYPEFLKKGDH